MLALILPLTVAGSISFAFPTPDDNAILHESYANINTTITDATVTTGLINWNNSLMGWWRMNEAPGGILVEDFSGITNNGMWSGNTTSNVTTGQFGNALSFDGINDYVNIPQSSTLSLTSNFTIESWVKTTSTDTYDTIISKGNSITTNYVMSIGDSALGHVYFYGYSGGNVKGGWTGTNYTTATVNDGNWHHIVGTFNGTHWILYIDSVNNLTFVEPAPIVLDSTSQNLTIGRRGARYGNISIDEVKLHNRVLSQNEINASYNAGLGFYNNFTNLANGNYTYQAYAQNLSGDVSQTGIRNLTIQVLSWQSYNDPAHNNIDNVFTAGESTVYMFGTGFMPAQIYKVAFSDGGNNYTKNITDNADSSGYLNASYVFRPGLDVAGTWHVQVLNVTGSASGTYTYGPDVLIEHSFVVESSAIPEFPAGMAIPLAGSLIIFAFMRNRINNGKK
jgi:hypothetical protein